LERDGGRRVGSANRSRSRREGNYGVYEQILEKTWGSSPADAPDAVWRIDGKKKRGASDPRMMPECGLRQHLRTPAAFFLAEFVGVGPDQGGGPVFRSLFASGVPGKVVGSGVARADAEGPALHDSGETDKPTGDGWGSGATVWGGPGLALLLKGPGPGFGVVGRFRTSWTGALGRGRACGGLESGGGSRQ